MLNQSKPQTFQYLGIYHLQDVYVFVSFFSWCFDFSLFWHVRSKSYVEMEYSKKYPNRIMKLANLVDEIKISNWRSTIQIWESTWPRPSSSWPNYFSVFPPNLGHKVFTPFRKNMILQKRVCNQKWRRDSFTWSWSLSKLTTIDSGVYKKPCTNYFCST